MWRWPISFCLFTASDNKWCLNQEALGKYSNELQFLRSHAVLLVILLKILSTLHMLVSKTFCLSLMNFSVQDKIHHWEDHAHLKENTKGMFCFLKYFLWSLWWIELTRKTWRGLTPTIVRGYMAILILLNQNFHARKPYRLMYIFLKNS